MKHLEQTLLQCPVDARLHLRRHRFCVDVDGLRDSKPLKPCTAKKWNICMSHVYLILMSRCHSLTYQM